MPVEPNETERTAEFRMVLLKLVEDAKRLCRIGDFCEYSSLSVIDDEEALHIFPFTLMPAFLTRERGSIYWAPREAGRASIAQAVPTRGAGAGRRSPAAS